MEPSEVEALVEQNPTMKQYMRVRKLLDANRAKAETQPGGMFRDFEISYDGVTHRLSDVVGRGGYVLVDFWASWCGPCIRQTAVIKDLYNEFKDKGLRVLGVAVWDEPDNTRKAIKDHDLPWECWLNGQTIPTDVYGISGIPCIILFGPDGKYCRETSRTTTSRPMCAPPFKQRIDGGGGCQCCHDNADNVGYQVVNI